MQQEKTSPSALLTDPFYRKLKASQFVIALAGNPNVGKSTIFNALTGLRQHTGNWPGKTVDNAQGEFTYQGRDFLLVDLPGTYSLLAHSAEEEVARDFITEGKPDATLIVVDASCLERNLNLALQVMEVTDNAVLCVNLLDEAKRKGIHVDLKRLEQELGIPVIGTTARTGEGLPELKQALLATAQNKVIHKIKRPIIQIPPNASDEEKVSAIYQAAEKITQATVQRSILQKKTWEHRLDDILTSRMFGYPIMLFLLSGVFWLTIEGANVPSELLAEFLFAVQDRLTDLFMAYGAPDWLHGLLVLGMYRSLAWVVSVMLPPMAIFFPLFTFLEDLGYLPRVAFNLDCAFRKCCASGKQALTMCMGFGCNAAGIVACRIIDSPRERLVAMLTNGLVPCNGRFPLLISISMIFISSMFAPEYGTLVTALCITFLVIVGIAATFAASWILSHTLLKGAPSSNILEMPPFRPPQIGSIIYRSIIDRTLFVLRRAIIMAAPAGAIIWLLANTMIGDASLLHYLADLLDPIAYWLGLDGVILLAFILGLPANEIVIPIILMSYLCTGQMIEVETLTELKDILVSNGWTWLTAVNTMLFCLLHWPCTTTLLTIYKESGSKKWTLAAFLLPTVVGLVTCFIVAFLVRLTGLV